MYDNDDSFMVCNKNTKYFPERKLYYVYELDFDDLLGKWKEITSFSLVHVANVKISIAFHFSWNTCVIKRILAELSS